MEVRLCGFLLCSLAAMISASLALADPSDPRLHGYINQGLVYTDDNSFYGDSEDLSWDFTSAALGTIWQAHSKVQLSAQAIYRQAGETSRDDVYVDFAQVDFKLIQNSNWQAGVRLGRIKNPFGFYNETRDIASTRPSILLPESIYRNNMREVIHTSDGVSLYASTYLGDNLIQLKWLKGDTEINERVLFEFLLQTEGKYIDENVELAQIMVESFGGLLRMGYSYTELEMGFEPEDSGIFLFPGDTRVLIDTLSLELNWQKWQLASEWQSFRLDASGYAFPGFTNSVDSLGYYATLSYRLDPDWQIFLRRDVVYNDDDDKDGRDYADQTGLPAHNQFAFDNTIGARWVPHKNWLFAAEAHQIKGTGRLSRIENNLAEASKDWNLFTLQVSFYF